MGDQWEMDINNTLIKLFIFSLLYLSQKVRLNLHLIHTQAISLKTGKSHRSSAGIAFFLHLPLKCLNDSRSIKINAGLWLTLQSTHVSVSFSFRTIVRYKFNLPKYKLMRPISLQHVSMMTLAFSSKHCCAEAHLHTAAKFRDRIYRSLSSEKKLSTLVMVKSCTADHLFLQLCENDAFFNLKPNVC